MGWWQSRSNNELVVGDIPLDALGTAISDVLDAYTGHLGRPPTIKEWEMLLSLALHSKSGRVFEDGANESVVVTIACTAESSDGS